MKRDLQHILELLHQMCKYDENQEVKVTAGEQYKHHNHHVTKPESLDNLRTCTTYICINMKYNLQTNKSVIQRCTSHLGNYIILHNRIRRTCPSGYWKIYVYRHPSG